MAAIVSLVFIAAVFIISIYYKYSNFIVIRKVMYVDLVLL